MRAVGNDGRVCPQQLKPRLPARRGKPLAQSVLRDTPALLAQHADRLDDKSRVMKLVRPQQMERQVFLFLIVKPLPGERMLTLPQRVKRRRVPSRAALSAYLPVHRVHGSVHRVCNGGRAGLDDPGLFARDPGERVTENGGVLKPDVRNNGGFGRFYHVRRVEPPAEADLEHHNIAFLRREIPKAHRGQNLKFRGRVGHAVGCFLHGLGGAAERRVGDVRAVNAEPLVHTHKVRGGVKARLVPRRRQNRGEHRARRALAVRPGDVDKFQMILRLAQPAHQFPHPFKTETAPFPIGAVDESERLLKLHALFPPLRAARGARARTASAVQGQTQRLSQRTPRRAAAAWPR